MKNSAIEWTDHTFSLWIGCTKVGPGCDHCYAEARMDTRLHRVQWGAGNPRVRTSPANWREPLPTEIPETCPLRRPLGDDWVRVEDGLPVVPDGEDCATVWTWDGKTVMEEEYGEVFEQPAGPAVGGWVSIGFMFSRDDVTHWRKHITPAPPSKRQQERRMANVTDKQLEAFKLIQELHRDLIVTMQAAWIEWRRGKGAEEAMTWIENTLAGPGLIPKEDEPYANEPQAYFDANQARPFPKCFCGRPSNTLWMGQGFCSKAHCDQRRAEVGREPPQ